MPETKPCAVCGEPVIPISSRFFTLAHMNATPKAFGWLVDFNQTPPRGIRYIKKAAGDGRENLFVKHYHKPGEVAAAVRRTQRDRRKRRELLERMRVFPHG